MRFRNTIRGGFVGLAALGCSAVAAGAQDCFYYEDYTHWLGALEVTSTTFSTLRDVAVSGEYAFVSHIADGIRVVDISNPAAPESVTTLDTPGNAYGVAVSGDYLYVADGTTGLQVVDISPATVPIITGAADTPGDARDLVVVGTLAYVAESTGGLVIIDISDPYSPVVVGSLPILADGGGANASVVVSGSYAFLTAGGMGLLVVDISNPATPEVAGSLPASTNAIAVDLYGANVILLDGSSGLLVLDVSTPTSPSILGSVDPFYGPQDIAMVGPYAFVADNFGDFKILDLTDPSNPFLVTTLAMPSRPLRVSAAGTQLFVTGIGRPAAGPDGYPSSVMSVVGASEAVAPAVLGTAEAADEFDDLAILGNLLYAPDYNEGIQIFDLSLPSTPASVGLIPLYWCQNNGVAIDGGRLYVTDRCRLHIYDLSSPLSPDSLGSVDMPYYAFGVAASGDYAYVNCQGSGIQVVDVSPPTAPVLVDSIAGTGGATSVVVVGTELFVVGEFESGTGLLIFDLTDPRTPVLAGSLDRPNGFRGIAVSGGHAFVGVPDRGTYVVDVSNPGALTVVAQIPMPPDPIAIALLGGIAYVLDQANGLHVINVVNPLAPVYLGSAPLTGYSAALATSGGRIYVARYGDGLAVLPAECADVVPPGLDIGVLQNPVLTSFIDVYVGANEPLAAVPVVSAGATELTPETVVGGGAPLYRAQHTLTGSGNVTIRAEAMDLVGNAGADSLAFVSFLVGAPGAAIASLDGALTVTVPAGALASETFLTFFGMSGGYDLQPRGVVVPGLEVRLDYGEMGFPGADPSRLALELHRGDSWDRIASFYDAEGGTILAALPALGPIRLREVEAGGSQTLPRAFTLHPSRPNPFGGATTITFDVPTRTAVSLRIFDAGGRLVRTLVEGTVGAGDHRSLWDGTDYAGRPVAPGIYFSALAHPHGIETRKVALIR